ncbi:hypothetical protein Tco_1104786 [Tanacetum coccineum]
MSTLQFAETHNMIAFLKKPAESNGFHEIIDFLNANQIYYALTVNPTIYTSCIEQFWATTKAKTVNGERQLQALVDKKKVIITESSIRSALHLEDVGGIDCLPTATIFKELARMGAKTTAWNEFSSTMASAIICLATNQKFNLSKYIFDAMVLDLEKAKDAQAKEIADLKKRDKDDLVAQEDASKQGRIFKDIDKDAEVIVDMAIGEKQEQSAKVDEREVSTGVEDNVAPTISVTTAGKGVTTAIDEINLAQTLIEIKAAKPKAVITAATTTKTTRPKARGVVVQEPSEFRTTTSSPQASQPSKTKDKGKAIMIEPEVPLKKKDQVALDEVAS